MLSHKEVPVDLAIYCEKGRTGCGLPEQFKIESEYWQDLIEAR
jgi:hypothetical protein